jgi:hypothetical protein
MGGNVEEDVPADSADEHNKSASLDNMRPANVSRPREKSN